MISKLIQLFKKYKPQYSDPHYLKESHMKYFPEFIKINDNQWELQFSPGNSLSINFNSKNRAVLYVSSGDPQSGYSTILYSESTTHDTLKYCIDRYSTTQWKMQIQRKKKIESLGI